MPTAAMARLLLVCKPGVAPGRQAHPGGPSDEYLYPA